MQKIFRANKNSKVAFIQQDLSKLKTFGQNVLSNEKLMEKNVNLVVLHLLLEVKTGI
jgi:hypothetical protein